MKREILTSLKFLGLMTLITGLLYPLLMTGIAQLVFPQKAGGSLIINDGKIIGSANIGQKFDSTTYFSSRPSASGYNTLPSGASNLGPTSAVLAKQVHERRLAFMNANGLADSLAVPVEMIFASGSGLDPHISKESALLQVNRIVAARHLDTESAGYLVRIINDLTEEPQLLLFGERRINVLKLNMELDGINTKRFGTTKN